MDTIAKLKKLFESGAQVSYEDLVSMGIVRVVDDMTFHINRLLEFQERYGLQSHAFYRSYEETWGNWYSGFVPDDEAEEWVKRYRLFLEAGGDPFSLSDSRDRTGCGFSQCDTSWQDNQESGGTSPALLFRRSLRR